MKHLHVDIGTGILEAINIRKSIEDLDSEFDGNWHVSLIASDSEESWALKLMSESGQTHKLNLSWEQQNGHSIQTALRTLKTQFNLIHK